MEYSDEAGRNQFPTLKTHWEFWSKMLHSFSVYLLYINPESWGNIIFARTTCSSCREPVESAVFWGRFVLCVQLTLPSDIHVLRWAKVSRTGLDVMHSGGTGGRSKMGMANKGVSDSRGRVRRRLEKRVINRAEQGCNSQSRI